MTVPPDANDPPEHARVVPSKDSITGEFSTGVDFISSVVAGLVLGLLLDWLFGTAPIFVIVGIIGGFISGFLKLWNQSAILERQAVRRTAWDGGDDD